MKRVDNAINVLLDKKHVCASTWTKLNATSALFFSRDAAPLVAIDGIFSRQFRVGSRAGPRGIFVFPSARSPDSSAGIRESEIAGALSLSLSLSLVVSRLVWCVSPFCFSFWMHRRHSKLIISLRARMASRHDDPHDDTTHESGRTRSRASLHPRAVHLRSPSVVECNVMCFRVLQSTRAISATCSCTPCEIAITNSSGLV